MAELCGFIVILSSGGSTIAGADTEDLAIYQAVQYASDCVENGSGIVSIELYCTECGGSGLVHIKKKRDAPWMPGTPKRCPDCKGKDSNRKIDLAPFEKARILRVHREENLHGEG